MKDSTLPMVSIIIPVKPGGYVRAVEAIKELNYPAGKLELLIAEGNKPSMQRNEAAKKASGEILYFLDDDSLPDCLNLKLLVAHYKDNTVGGVGGPSITPETDSFIQRCFAALLCSPFGGGGIRNRYQRTGVARETFDSELILCNLSFRADLYTAMGGLNEELYPNEENELMSRVQAAGLKLVHDPDIYVLRSQRKSLRAFVRQMFTYGRGRMEQTLVSPASAKAIHFMPALFVIYVAALPLMSSFFLMLPVFFYIFLSLIFSLRAVKKVGNGIIEKLEMLPVLFILFPVMKIAYGTGTIYGLKKLFSPAPEKGVSKVLIKKPDIF